MSGKDIGSVASETILKVSQFIEELMLSFDSIIVGRIQEYYMYVADAILPIVSGLVLAWILYRGIQMMVRPNAAQSLSDFLIKSLKILIITMFAYSWGYIGATITDVLINGAPALINKMTNTNSDTLILSFVDKLIANFSATLKTFDFNNIAATAFAIAIVGLAMFFIAVALIISYFYLVLKSKFTVAILLVLTPIIFTSLMFERTRGYVMNWVNALVLPLLTLLLLNLIIGLLGGVMLDVLKNFLINGENIPLNASGAFLAIVVGFIMFKLIQEAPSMASNLVSSGFGMATSDASFNPINKYRQYRKNKQAQKFDLMKHNQLVNAIKGDKK